MISIFDIVDKESNITNDVLQVKEMFENNLLVFETNDSDFILLGDAPSFDMSFEQYIDKNNFKKWKYKGLSLTVNRFKQKVNINNISDSSSDEDLIHYLEYVYNMLMIFDKKCYYDELTFNALTDTIIQILSKINLEIKKIDNQKYIIIEKCVALNSVISQVPKNIQIPFIEYLNVENTVEEKRQILKKLADYFEGEKKIFENSKVSFTKNLFSDTQYYFNNYNIRHNNLKGTKLQEKVKNMPQADLEKVYDSVYNNCLILILLLKYEPFDSETKINKTLIPHK